VTDPNDLGRLAGSTRGERRPGPEHDFRTRLRERLTDLDARARRPEHLWWLIGAYICAGATLLVLAALGAAGGSPLSQ
jgi:hypothetical protein